MQAPALDSFRRPGARLAMACVVLVSWLSGHAHAAEPAGRNAALWTAYATQSFVFDSNIDHVLVPRSAYGLLLGVGVGWQSRRSHPLLDVDYEVAGHEYRRADQWDRTSHHLRAAFSPRIGQRLSLQTIAEASLKGTSEDRELGDQYLAMQRIEYELGRRTELRAYAAYRLRRYDALGVEREGFNRYFGLTLKREIGEASDLELGSRIEYNRPRAARNRYSRLTSNVAFETRLGAADLMTFELKHRWQRYDSRLIEIEDEDGDDHEVLRRDQRWIPTLSWSHTLTRGLVLQLDYKYERRFSNDPDREFGAHQLGVGVTYFWGVTARPDDATGGR